MQKRSGTVVIRKNRQNILQSEDVYESSDINRLPNKVETRSSMAYQQRQIMQKQRTFMDDLRRHQNGADGSENGDKINFSFGDGKAENGQHVIDLGRKSSLKAPEKASNRVRKTVTW